MITVYVLVRICHNCIILRWRHYRCQLGGHDVIDVRAGLSRTLRDLQKISYYHHLTWEELKDVDFSGYLFMGE